MHFAAQYIKQYSTIDKLEKKIKKANMTFGEACKANLKKEELKRLCLCC